MTLERREIVAMDLPVAPDVVWQHLREPYLIRRWYRWDSADLDAEIHRDFVERVAEGHVVEGRATTRTLTWPTHDVVTVRSSVEAPGGTHLTITRSSHELGSYDGLYDERDAVWTAAAEQLRFALVVQPGQERRTLSVFGLDAGDRRDRLMDRVGLHGVRGVPLGGNVQARRPDGTLLGATLIRKDPDLLVLSLHGITAALMVIEEVPAGSAPPHGTVGAVLSTYGLDDATFEQVQSRWSSWWRSAMPRPTGIGI